MEKYVRMDFSKILVRKYEHPFDLSGIGQMWPIKVECEPTKNTSILTHTLPAMTNGCFITRRPLRSLIIISEPLSKTNEEWRFIVYPSPQLVALH